MLVVVRLPANEAPVVLSRHADRRHAERTRDLLARANPGARYAVEPISEIRIRTEVRRG